jgi:hypothetical protein
MNLVTIKHEFLIANWQDTTTLALWSLAVSPEPQASEHRQSN